MNKESMNTRRTVDRRSWLLAVGTLVLLVGTARTRGDEPASALIGYTELRTNLPGGRHANITTSRAAIVRSDGTGRRLLAPELAREPNTWTQFAGWSPDGKTAIIGQGWESPQNAKWEEDHKTFRFTAEGWRHDMYLLDLRSGRLTNLTAIDRVSFYNSGLFFWPGDSKRLGFQALIDGNSHPFSMDRDGRNKHDLTKDSKEFAYGFSVSPDGRRIAYHKNYQIYVAQANGSQARKIESGQPFNFVPQWSPDGSWILFLAGEHYNCHPHIVRPDGTGLRKLADRHGYKGVVEFLDVPDFHGGSSDVPVWSAGGKSVLFTAPNARNIELHRVSLDGKVERLTNSPPGTANYHPHPSPDGKWVVFGSKREGSRRLYVLCLEDGREHRITNLKAGHAAMWPHWSPARRSE